MAAGGDLGRPSEPDWGRKVSVFIHPFLPRRKEGNDECGGGGGDGLGEFAASGTPGIWPPELTSVNALFSGAGLYWGSSNLAPPPQSLFFFGGDGERGGALLCVWGWGWGGGGSENFWLLSDAGPVSLAQWGCVLITYLIREEFKLCVLGRRQGWGQGATPRDHQSKFWPVVVRCLQSLRGEGFCFLNSSKVLNRPQILQWWSGWPERTSQFHIVPHLYYSLVLTIECCPR